MCLRGALSSLDGIDAPDEEFPSPILQREHIPRPKRIQEALQSSPIRSQEEKLPPEPLCEFSIVVVLKSSPY